MGNTKRAIRSVLETLEKESKRGVEKTVKTFTELPKAMIEQALGTSLTPETNVAPDKKNFTDLDVENLRENFAKQDSPELEDVRERLKGLSNPETKRRFDEFKQEEKQAIQSRANEEEKRKQKEKLEAEQQKKHEEEKKVMSEQGFIPKGKERKSIFSRKKPTKTAENRPAFGKQ